MYAVVKLGSEIYLRQLGSAYTLPDGDVVIFRVSSRNPAEWEPMLVQFLEARKKYPPIMHYISGLDKKEEQKWSKFTSDIKEIAEKNDRILQTKIAKIKNEKFRNENPNSSNEDYITNITRRYENHCWQCHAPVDSQSELGHKVCGWLICSTCGACGCGYSDK